MKLNRLLIACLLCYAVNAPAQMLRRGNMAPEITLPLASGQSFSLSSLKGSLVLIDFWASWCAPCVKEQPELKALYHRYTAGVKDHRFEILGVSLDKNRADWENAIRQQGNTWPQVSDLKFWRSQTAKDYAVDELPFNVLIDEKGRIIAINRHGKTLKKIIQDHFTKEKSK